MAAAYATIANGGEYIEPTFYTKMENASGKIALEPKQEKRRVLSEQNAYVLANILKAPVYGFLNDGYATSTNCRIPGIETGAKSGTTTSYKDRWLCGITPYYAAATWFGFDEPESVTGFYISPASQIWESVMKQVHEDLPEAEFKKPSGIVTARICKTTGKVATSKCKNTYTEVFASGTVPSACTGHEEVKICKESKKLATEYCPETESKVYPVKPEKERNASWVTNSKTKYTEIKDKCTIHTAQTMNAVVPNVIGKTEAAAKDELKGFVINVVYSKDKSKADGIVLKQSLKVGDSVKKGSSITLTINDIPEESEVPPVKPENEAVENTVPSGENEEIVANSTETTGTT